MLAAGWLTKISHISLTYHGALPIGPSLHSTQMQTVCLTTNVVAAFFFQVSLNGLPSMYYSAMFQNLKTSAPSLGSMTHSSYLVLSEAHTQRAGKSGPQVWPNEPFDLRVRLG